MCLKGYLEAAISTVCYLAGELAFIRLSVLEMFTIPTGDDTYSNLIPTDGGFKFGQSSVNSVYVMLVTINIIYIAM